MRRVLRSIIDFDSTVTSANLIQNFQTLLSAPIEWGREDDKRIFEFVKLYFQQRIDLPSQHTVRDFFQNAGDIDVIERINDISGAEPYIRTNFTYLIRSVIDAQNRAKFIALTKEAQDIATKGLVIEGERRQGLADAINHVVHNAHNLLIPEHGSRIRGDIREDGSEVQRDYERAETDKALAWGKFCGLNEIDSIVKGIRKGELWVHAAYSGELKTTFACTWCYNLVTRYRSNVFYTTLEMPYEQLRMMIYTMHSSHTKWKMQGYAPLKYDKVKDGQLTKEEKEFYWKVIDDFEHNEEYGSFFVWSPSEDVTTDDIKMEAEMRHKQAETGLLVIDHGGIVEPRKKKRSKDFVIELNSVIRDSKRLALHFNDGERVPVLLLFQINREGKDYADKNEGRYKLRALSYANECLAEGTLIECSTGLRPIQSVSVGDLVWSSTGWKSVLATFDQGVRDVYDVCTSAGQSIRATGNHRLRVLDVACGVVWKRVDELQALTDRVMSATHVPWLVTEVRSAGAARVYDLEVGGDHEYASAGFLSHNCERSADIVTTTYLNEEHRKNGTTVFDCLKRRDGEFFKPFIATVQWDTKRITNCDPYAGAQGKGITLDDRRNIVDLLVEP